MLLYIFVVLVKLIVFHSCTIDVFFRYVRTKKFIIIISGVYATEYSVNLIQCQHRKHDCTLSCCVKYTYLL